MKRPKQLVSKKTKMLSDEDVRRWNDNFTRKSRNTAEVAVRRLSKFCELNRTTPKALIQIPKKQLFNSLLDTVTNLENEDYAGTIFRE